MRPALFAFRCQRLTALRAAGQSGGMASKKVFPTPPPGGPALVRTTRMARPALGALLLGLSGMACGDDGGGETGGDTELPPMPATEGPMPNPTTDATSVAPMIPPTTSTGESADTGSSTDGGTEIPPMPGPETTTDDGGSSSSGSDSGSTGEIPPMPPPMPPPDGGAAPDDPEI